MNTARVIEVIETTLTKRGDGKDNPIRIITQYWSKDGNLLAEVDPCPDPQPIPEKEKEEPWSGIGVPEKTFDEACELEPAPPYSSMSEKDRKGNERAWNRVREEQDREA